MKIRVLLAALALLLCASLAISPAAFAQATGPGTGPGSTAGAGAAAGNTHGEEIDLPIGEPDKAIEGDKEPPPDEDDDNPDDPGEDDPPKLYDEELPTRSDSIIYVLDISGSMGWDYQSYTGLDGNTTNGNRLDRAKVELIRSIQGLSRDFEFNVYAYDCDIRRWSNGMQPAEPGPKAAAVAWINRLQDMGATGTGPAVAQALRDNRDNKTVVLLSDGAPNCGANSTQGHRRMIQQANSQGAVIHTFGIACYGEFEAFMRQVAADSGGQYHAVP